MIDYIFITSDRFGSVRFGSTQRNVIRKEIRKANPETKHTFETTRRRERNQQTKSNPIQPKPILIQNTKQNPTMMMIPHQTSRAATILLWVASLLVASAQMGTQQSELPLFATSVVHCDEMIALHRWEGSCCSLNVTQGNGCVLNVMGK